VYTVHQHPCSARELLRFDATADFDAVSPEEAQVAFDVNDAEEWLPPADPRFDGEQ
jgi:hypothetical protein